MEVRIDREQIDRIFADLDQCRLPGAAVAIAIDGKPVYRRAFGLASMELPLCLTPSTRIRIGSTTKQFTCLAYLLLCEEGKAAIDDSIGTYLPEVHPLIRSITLEQLMSNTGGLRDALAIVSQFRGHLNAHVFDRPTTSEEILALYRTMDDVDVPPGTAWRYNNGGFLLLSLIIERIAGQPLEQVMHERIFRPLGMHDTLLKRWDTDFVANSATCHHLNARGHHERAYFGYDYAGAGAIVSTADDMLRWLAAMDTHAVGSARTWAAMTTPRTLLNGNSCGYGLGLFIDEYRGVKTIHHAGGWVGASTQALKVPAAGLDIVVMANRGDVPSVLKVNQILDACIVGLEPAPARRCDSFVRGLFRSPDSGRVIELYPHEGQQIASIDGLDVPMEPAQDGVWRACGTLAALKKSVCALGDAHSPSKLGYCDAGATDELVPVPSTGGETAQIGGRYYSETTGIEAAITVISGAEAVMRMASRFGSLEYRLQHLGADLWRAKPSQHTDGVITLEGREAFRFSSLFIRGLRFRRAG